MDSTNNSASNGSESSLEANLGEAPLIEIIEVDEILSTADNVQVPISSCTTTTLEQDAFLEENEPATEISKHSDDYVLKREKECGVVHFINAQVKGFPGKLKARFSDFIVNEIDKEGKIVHLTNIQLTPTIVEEKVISKESIKEVEQLDMADIFSLLENYIGAALAEQVKTFIDNEDTSKTINCETEVISDKIKRSEIHAFFKTHFPRQFITEARDGRIVIKKSDGKIDRRDSKKRKRGEVDWKGTGNNYCEFVLLKENKDNMDAIGILANAMRVPRKVFSFAGTKDKRGITVQKVTAFKTTEKMIINANKYLRNIKVGNCKYVETDLKLGDLKGNRFSLAIREIPKADIPDIKLRIETLIQHGFINYYGLQRFGSRSIPTHAIGVLLLKGEWSSAIDLIMNPQSDDNEQIKVARKSWLEEGDAKKALSLFPHFCTAEKSILQFFVANQGTKDMLGALSLIPRTMRLMYVHAYQSYIWNHMVNMRIEKFGFSPVVGDLAMIGNEVVVVKESDLMSVKMSQIVLPLPGIDSLYPEHEIKDAYVEFMKRDGLDLFNMDRKQKVYALSGSYRRILGVVKDVVYDFTTYNNEIDQLILSDLDNLNETKLESFDNGELDALRIAFSLDASHYATMAIRELMKRHDDI